MNEKEFNNFFCFNANFPSLGCSAWFNFFSTQKADLYLDTSSIKREKTSIFLSQLVNYKVKQKNGMLSLKTISEINCKNLSIRDLEFFLLLKRKWEKEKIFIQVSQIETGEKPKKKEQVYIF